jgi:hypothetical protein
VTMLSMKVMKVEPFTKIETSENPHGLLAVSYGSEFCVAAPHKDSGKVQI